MTPPPHRADRSLNDEDDDGDNDMCCLVDQLDGEFEQLGCLGHGVSSSVFLARKQQSGRKVVLKMMPPSEQDEQGNNSEQGSSGEDLLREMRALKRLNSRDARNRDLGVSFLEQPVIANTSTRLVRGLVLQYVEGGTLAQEIDSKAKNTDASYGDTYTERRIAWYALQLADALAFCHERQVYHMDIKSPNVLVDRRNGGTLILADFGSALVGAKNQEPVGFTEIYGAPELLTAYHNDELASGRLDAEKMDAFGLGCILFEMLCCRKLVDLTEQETLAEFIKNHNGNGTSFLDLPCIRLPWLSASSEQQQPAGYSPALKSLVQTLLQKDPQHRWTPSQLCTPLREDILSPLLADFVVAARQAVPGCPVTVDNVQFGMFVQRRVADWNDGDADGGAGSIGVVTQLEADAAFCTVSWPIPGQEPILCRIGASGKYELQVGPTTLPDFFTGNMDTIRNSGVVEDIDTNQFCQGQIVNRNCMVVVIIAPRRRLLVAPIDRFSIPPSPVNPICFPPVTIVGPSSNDQSRNNVPSLWQGFSNMIEVTDVDERRSVSERFHSEYEITPGNSAFEIRSIVRVQSEELWQMYSQQRDAVAFENWGLANERRIFYGTGSIAPVDLVRRPSEICDLFRCRDINGALSSKIVLSVTNQMAGADSSAHLLTSGWRQVVQLRVTLGRALHSNHGGTATVPVTYHSEVDPHDNVSIRNPFQISPEYIVSYKWTPPTPRRVVRAMRPTSSNSTRQGGNAQVATSPNYVYPQQAHPSPTALPAGSNGVASSQPVPENTKMCVICLSHPVSFILLPCGHPCLCETCSSTQTLARLHWNCPECRQRIGTAARFYGRVAND